MLIADLKSSEKQVSFNRQLEIENRKWLGWPTRPGSQKLGAKWVEVRIRQVCGGG